MPFDVFALRDHVVREYREYVESFIHIRDQRIERFVQDMLAQGELWPDAVLQLNPGYEPADTLVDLAAAGMIGSETARFFGPKILLHRHQADAVAAAHKNEPYLVSTGTGSGKSLTYLVPIVDHVLKNKPADHSVRALIVYPTNALINSQLKALQDFKKNWPDCPVTFSRYTGQDRGKDRDRILTDPPHILLTNYVMLEYMLIRPTDRSLLHQATRALKFLVVDELHVYRGRQGADVAMLMRRVRQRAGRDDLLCIGTSATLATGEDRNATRARIAEVGGRFFGVTIKPENVIDEKLRRVTTAEVPTTIEALRTALRASPPAPTVASVTSHPIGAWVETTFGLAMGSDGRLERRKPMAFEDGVAHLVEKTGLPEPQCNAALRAVLDAGNAAEQRPSEPVFAFRLHQFLSSGGSVYATLEAPDARSFSSEGPYYAPKEAGRAENRVMYPLAFCRECGQEHYLCSFAPEKDGAELLPRSPLLHVTDEDLPGDPGFVSLDDGSLWREDEDLPDNFVEMRRSGPRVKAHYQAHVPRRIWVAADGKASETEIEGGLAAWWQPRPLMLCLRCRAAYDLRESDFRKLVTLSQTGRSTATTVVATTAVTGLPQFGVRDTAEPPRLLSFTDNRQDASLQAGHTNDFVQVVQLRAALVKALRSAQGNTLTFDALGEAVFAALDPKPEHFMKEPVDAGPGFVSARNVMMQVLHYLAVEDLARAWRVAQPNLEQTGLLKIDYTGLDELVANETLWSHPIIGSVAPPTRKTILTAILDHMRSVLVLDDRALTDDETRRLVQRANAVLREPWSFDEHERLRRGGIATLPQVIPSDRDRDVALRLGARSAIARYLRSRRTWGIDENLSADDVEKLIASIVTALRGHIFRIIERNGQPFGAQIMVSALRWRLGDSNPPPPDPVRGKSLHLRREDETRRHANAYFGDLYQQALGGTGNQQPKGQFKGLLTAEHTGQVSAERRELREKNFNSGELPILFCSPTMELGVDIKDLSVVHMRNVPPTPANYAQRSGRAGRGGKAALVVAFASHGNVHDRYFFHRAQDMIAGVVAPPRIDIVNKELVEAHLQSTWLSIVKPGLGQSIADVLDLDKPDYPLREDLAAQLKFAEQSLEETLDAFRGVISSCGPELAQAHWYSQAWLEDIARSAPQRFDDAFRRWRELYKAATQQRESARKIIDNPRAARKDRDTAEQREREAKREIQLLLNGGDSTETDFYVYRYLATEGFLPGYNFPRLPVRALVATGDQAQAIDRPRFIGLVEFGPGNSLYHEGRKHRIASVVVPAGGIEERLTRAKLCNSCGYVHPRDQADVDLCIHCGTRLDGATSQYPQSLFQQPTVRAQRWTRITSEEEERVREGYLTTTHFRSGGGAVREHRSLTEPETGNAILSALYLPQAELWRINHGWRKSSEQVGFIIDSATGRWRSRDDADDGDNGGGGVSGGLMTGIRPFVTDSRNLLLLRPISEQANDEGFLKSLAYALRRALQVEYQIEEREVAVELIGREDNENLLFWEAAEGGIGVWERLIAEPREFKKLATCALEILHFDPSSGQALPDWEERCTAACYDCLLSYSNQPDHRHLDRHKVRKFLFALSHGEIAPTAGGPTYEEQYRRLLGLIDPASSFERAFLDYLYKNQLRLPDHAQHTPAFGIPVQPDFYYEREGIPGICIFIDGPQHDNQDQVERDRAVREALKDQGFRVIAIRVGRTIADQISENIDIFRRN
jgi:superfamily II DNA/RNA helicase